MILNIITLATKEYNFYIQTIIETYKFLFPEIHKKLFVITDLPFICEDENVFMLPITDDNLSYKFIQWYKPYYIMNVINLFNLSDNDRFLWVDSRSLFFEKPNKLYNKDWEKICKYDLHFSFSPLLPYMIANNERELTINEILQSIIRRFDDNNSDLFSYIYNKNYWISGSLWGGNIGKFRLFFKAYEILVFEDIHHNFIPTYPDEYTLTKLVNDICPILNLTYIIDLFAIIEEIDENKDKINEIINRYPLVISIHHSDGEKNIKLSKKQWPYPYETVYSLGIDNNTNIAFKWEDLITSSKLD